MAEPAPGWLPRVIGHRGAAGHAPENTLAGFRAARALGVAWVELDVRLTADGRVILLHDETLDRTTDGTGAAARLDLDRIAVCDAGAWFDPRFAGEAVPTLEQAIELLAELGLGANIELKPQRGAAAATAAAACRIIETKWPAASPAPLLSSFAVEALGAARAQAPGLARALLLDRLGADWPDRAAAVAAVAVHCNQARLTRTLVDRARAAGYPLLAYTVNEPDRAAELFGWGVTGLFSDFPDRLLGLP